MLNWKKVTLEDAEEVQKIVEEAGVSGSDTSFANMYLLQEKYETEICLCEGFLIRYYHGEDTRKGYTFPLGKGDIIDSQGKMNPAAGDVKAVLNEIKKDSELRTDGVCFTFLTEEQKDFLQGIFPELEFRSDRGDSDYLYLCESLRNLPGKLSKKRNHISKFYRTYEDVSYRQIDASNFEDAIYVENKWAEENKEKHGNAVMIEHRAICEAVKNFRKLRLTGIVLYANDRPVAMTIGSFINPEVVDVHFEKAYGQYASKGAYAVINNLFAKYLNKNYETVRWLNREEDVNIPGLRKAKESYHPEILLKKYCAGK